MHLPHAAAAERHHSAAGMAATQSIVAHPTNIEGSLILATLALDRHDPDFLVPGDAVEGKRRFCILRVESQSRGSKIENPDVAKEADGCWPGVDV